LLFSEPGFVPLSPIVDYRVLLDIVRLVFPFCCLCLFFTFNHPSYVYLPTPFSLPISASGNSRFVLLLSLLIHVKFHFFFGLWCRILCLSYRLFPFSVCPREPLEISSLLRIFRCPFWFRTHHVGANRHFLSFLRSINPSEALRSALEPLFPDFLSAFLFFHAAPPALSFLPPVLLFCR